MRRCDDSIVETDLIEELRNALREAEVRAAINQRNLEYLERWERKRGTTSQASSPAAD